MHMDTFKSINQALRQERKGSSLLTMLLISQLVLDGISAQDYLVRFILHQYPTIMTAWDATLYWLFLAIDGIFLLAIWKWKKWGAYGVASFSLIRFVLDIILNVHSLPTAFLRVGTTALTLVYLRPVWKYMK
jgi:hypothetical protein